LANDLLILTFDQREKFAVCCGNALGLQFPKKNKSVCQSCASKRNKGLKWPLSKNEIALSLDFMPFVLANILPIVS
jgi:hypothetical protein